MTKLQIWIRLFSAIIVWCFLLIPTIAHAGAWLQEEGQGEVIINYTFFNSDESYDAFGDKVKTAQFGKSEISPYYEYGVHKDLTIGGAMSYQTVISTNVNQQADDFQFSYYDIFARTYLLKRDDILVSIEPRLHIPVEENASLNPEGDDIIPELKLSIGAPFKLFSEYSFADAGATYRFRDEDTLGNELNDMLELEATIGLKLESDIMLLNQIFYKQSLGRKAGDTTSGNYELTKLQFSLAYDYWETVYLQAGVFANIDGINTNAGEGILFSVWYKF